MSAGAPPVRAASLAAFVAGCLALASCGIHYRTPTGRARDARFGYLGGAGPAPTHAALCRDWRAAVGRRDPRAASHVSFPEVAPDAACFTRVRYTADRLRVDAPPPGCEYPDADARAALRALAARLESAPTPAPASTPPPDALLACALPLAARAAARSHNARVLRATADRLEAPGAPRYPYAAVVAFGYGWEDQALTSIAAWRPGDRCRTPAPGDVARLGVMVQRTRRVAEALRAGVAPMAIVSGGPAHSSMVEAFAMLYLLRCLHGVRADRVLVEPCADHTHTNMRNSGRWLVALGARVAYVVTDDGLQADYLQEWNGFELVMGGLDTRALRDWGYLVGAWRQAVEGPSVGFWYTPYRFWAEPRAGLGSLTCLDGEPAAP